MDGIVTDAEQESSKVTSPAVVLCSHWGRMLIGVNIVLNHNDWHTRPTAVAGHGLLPLTNVCVSGGLLPMLMCTSYTEGH